MTDTELCNYSFNRIQGQTTFIVFQAPRYLSADFDGGMGWYSLSRNVLSIDGFSESITFLAEVPEESVSWCTLFVNTNSQTLDLRIPHNGESEGILCIDSGSDGGVSLPREEWTKWRNAHPTNALTYKTDFSGLDGLQIQPESWAETISFGPLVPKNVPITTEGPKK